MAAGNHEADAGSRAGYTGRAGSCGSEGKANGIELVVVYVHYGGAISVESYIRWDSRRERRWEMVDILVS